MPKRQRVYRPELSVEYGVRIGKRLQASSLYYSGRLDTLFRKSVEDGASTWRILRYEQIIDPEEFPFPIPLSRYVRPRTFEKHLRYLQKKCHVLALETLLSRLKDRKPILPNTVVITLDNGWIDSYVNAFPLLQKYGVPATIFLPTALIGERKYFWYDAVMFSVLTLFVQGENLSSLPFLSLFFSTPLDAYNEADVKIVVAKTAEIINMLRLALPQERYDALVALGKEVDRAGGLPLLRCFISWEEVRVMAHHGISFGSIGHTGHAWDEFPEESIIEEVEVSRLKFREAKIECSKALCYPEGIVTRDSRRVLKQAGFEYGLGIGSYLPAAASEDNLATLLGRVPIYEGISFCKELLACRLWAPFEYGFMSLK